METGLNTRCEVLVNDYVDCATKNEDSFNAPFLPPPTKCQGAFIEMLNTRR